MDMNATNPTALKMDAVVFTKSGPPEVLQLKKVERPTPRNDEILVKIRATTVTSGDVLLRSLKFPYDLIFRIAFGLGKYKINGHEFAGDVVQTGKSVKRFKTGDPVFASTGHKGGTYAEYICLSEDRMVAGKPTTMTYEEAAAVPVGANTALHILRKGNIQSGQKVLVYGASGSVGTYAVQLAKVFGAEVTGVCSTTNVDLVKSLGADKVIDYTQTDFTQNGEDYDVVFDAVAKISAERAAQSLHKNGHFLSVSSSTSENTENLIYLKDLIEHGQIRAVIDRRYPLRQIVEAHRYVEQGHKKGNVVITVADG